ARPRSCCSRAGSTWSSGGARRTRPRGGSSLSFGCVPRVGTSWNRRSRRESTRFGASPAHHPPQSPRLASAGHDPARQPRRAHVRPATDRRADPRHASARGRDARLAVVRRRRADRGAVHRRLRAAGMTTPATKHWSGALADLHACEDAIAWAATQPTPEAAWRTCDRGDWMLFAAGKSGAYGEPWSEQRKPLVLAACACARLALPHTKDERVLACIEAAERWCRDQATVSEVCLARHAAAAAHAADADPDAYAAANAAYAAAVGSRGAARAAGACAAGGAALAAVVAVAAAAYAAVAADAAAVAAVGAACAAAAAAAAADAHAAYAAAYAAAADAARFRVLAE